MKYSVVLFISCSLNVYCMESSVSIRLPSKESITGHEKLFKRAKKKYNKENNISKKKYYYYLAKLHSKEAKKLAEVLGEKTSIVFDIENIYAEQTIKRYPSTELDETSNVGWIKQILLKNKSNIK